VTTLPKIVFVGHTSVDRIRNARGEKVQPGGAALYAAVGAKTVYGDVGIVTAVGYDYQFGDVFNDFESATVKRVKEKSTEFFITYDKDWNASYRKVSIGPGSQITTRDVLGCVGRGAQIIHLAPMNPPKVRNMVRAVKEANKDVLVSINSCINYFDDKANRRAVLDAASQADIFILNERELHALTGIELVSKAIKTISAKTLVLTLGEIGTIISSPGSTEFIPAMAAITKNAVDVTGAGDTWSGSFIASYFRSGSWIKAVSFASVVSAIKCTGWNFEKIRRLRFENVEDIYDLAIALKEKGRQLTLSDALKAVRLES
jgi:sugar/nucleoside kinase (ribokinase family)